MGQGQIILNADLRVVVLVGRQDFGRCPLGARLPAALWPIGERSTLERLLDHLAKEGIDKATVCCDVEAANPIRSLCAGRSPATTVLTEDFSNGTAGCLRDAVASDPGELILVMSAAMLAPPSIKDLVELHQAENADLTMVFNPAIRAGDGYGLPAEIYLCRPEVLRHIPRGGYSDIKEGLIPTILRAGGTVRPAVLARDVGSFHDRDGYLKAVSTYLSSDERAGESCERASISAQASIHPSVRMYGPVTVGPQARILENAVVVGPAMIGPQAQIGSGSFLARSVLWDKVEIGSGCKIYESVVGTEASIGDGAMLVGDAVAAGSCATERELARERTERMSERNVKSHGRSAPGVARAVPKGGHRIELSPSWIAPLCGGAAIVVAFLWCYAPTIQDLRDLWQRSDEYSAGLLVPLLAGYVLWSRRQELRKIPIRPAIMAGVAFFVLAQAFRGFGLFYMYDSAERLSLVLSIAALAVLVPGWRFAWKISGVLLFLFLMVPWPNRVQAALALPLQRWATASAVFGLELIGYEVVQDGNVIRIGQTSVAVAEACNGLRMITAFFVISGLVVLLVKRTWWEKLLVLMSSLPIALLCNTLRLTITAVFFTLLQSEAVEKLFHDFGGYAMMPLALAMVVGELWLLMRLTTARIEPVPEVIARQKPRRAANS